MTILLPDVSQDTMPKGELVNKLLAFKKKKKKTDSREVVRCAFLHLRPANKMWFLCIR